MYLVVILSSEINAVPPICLALVLSCMLWAASVFTFFNHLLTLLCMLRCGSILYQFVFVSASPTMSALCELTSS